MQVLHNAALRRALIVGCLLMIFQQISGINTVMYYSATIIEMSGVRDHSQAIWLSAATSAMNFLCTFIGLYLVERAGRRLLTLTSLGGAAISLLVLGLGFHLTSTHSPNVLYRSNSTDHALSDCAVYSSCEACITNPACGFCFKDMGSSHDPRYNSSCLPTDKDHSSFSANGTCSQANGTMEHLEKGYTWAYEWCPTSYSWIILMGLLLYLFFFAPGMGPMPWTINSEIYPLWARGTCFSIATSFCWLFNLAVSMTFLTFTDALTKYGTFYMYAGLSILGFALFYFWLPETKGRNLEEVETLFSHPWWQDATTIADRKIVQSGDSPSPSPSQSKHELRQRADSEKSSSHQHDA